MTIKDIARRSGYAVGTVSRVLNGTPGVSPEARSRVLAVVAETGFQPNDNARHLKQRRSESIAIIVKGVGNMLFASILETMQSLIKAAGKAAAVYYLDEDDNEVEQAVRVCRELKPMGILFLGGNRGNFLKSFGQIVCPCVLVSNRASAMGFPNLSSVATDDIDGAASAMGFLLDAGHRAVGVIGGESCVVSRSCFATPVSSASPAASGPAPSGAFPSTRPARPPRPVSPWRAATRAPGSCWTVCRS